ncbi:GNAT family N-acetyltransferase [Butyrivibrio sp. LC3010]|uniref:GNAT family N-acetyltransferase n=1 Tax=Butyrivibrio sp. LC3010 TaxID=1280680 RepID=UPI0004262C8A|nr:GNAT family N-acetyltransferase [Butyrivibrio sp. LC3010]
MSFDGGILVGNANIELKPMTRELCHALFREWENDPDIYSDMSLFKPFIYTKEYADKYFDSKQKPDRKMLAIMLEDKPIGEIQLKQIDFDKKECTLSIHMQNDSYKGKGYGTTAEKLAIEYAFSILGMNAVNADTIIENKRSQHILEKLGFKFLKEEDGFIFYRIQRS